jgi:hypothetical protein
MEDRYGGHDAMAVATWGNVEVLASGEDEQTALGEVAGAVCLELREHADHLEARRGALLDEIERLKRENATLRAAYAQDLDGLRAELRRATWTRDVIGEHHE